MVTLQLCVNKNNLSYTPINLSHLASGLHIFFPLILILNLSGIYMHILDEKKRTKLVIDFVRSQT